MLLAFAAGGLTACMRPSSGDPAKMQASNVSVTADSSAPATSTASAAPVAPAGPAVAAGSAGESNGGRAVSSPRVRGTNPAPAAGMASAAAAAPATPASEATAASHAGATGSTPAGPQVLSVVVSPRVIHAGQTVAWVVRTTDDVVSVAAHVSAYNLPMQRTGPGRFTLNFTIPPNVPGFFHGTYNLDVRGENASGASADRRVSLVFE